MRRNWTDTVKLHNARVRATQIALDKGELVRCRWCDTPTANLGTRECDRCWELRHRIEQDPALAERMLETIGRETWRSVTDSLPKPGAGEREQEECVWRAMPTGGWHSACGRNVLLLPVDSICTCGRSICPDTSEEGAGA